MTWRTVLPALLALVILASAVTVGASRASARSEAESVAFGAEQGPSRPGVPWLAEGADVEPGGTPFDVQPVGVLLVVVAVGAAAGLLYSGRRK